MLGITQGLGRGQLTLYDDNGDEMILGDVDPAMKFGVKSRNEANKAGYDSFYAGFLHPTENNVEVANTKGMKQKKIFRLEDAYGKEYMSGYEKAKSDYLVSDRYLYGRLKNAGSDEEKMQALTDIMHIKGDRAAVRIGAACLGSAAFAELLALAAPFVVDALVPALESDAPEVLNALKSAGTKAVDVVNSGAQAANEYLSPLTQSNIWKGVKMFNKLNTVKNIGSSIASGNVDKTIDGIGSYALNRSIGNLCAVGALYSTARTGYNGFANANALIGDTADLIHSAAGSIGNLYSGLTGAGRKWGEGYITENHTPSRRPGGSMKFKSAPKKLSRFSETVRSPTISKTFFLRNFKYAPSHEEFNFIDGHTEKFPNVPVHREFNISDKIRESFPNGLRTRPIFDWAEHRDSFAKLLYPEKPKTIKKAEKLWSISKEENIKEIYDAAIRFEKGESSFMERRKDKAAYDYMHSTDPVKSMILAEKFNDISKVSKLAEARTKNLFWNNFTREQKQMLNANPAEKSRVINNVLGKIRSVKVRPTNRLESLSAEYDAFYDPQKKEVVTKVRDVPRFYGDKELDMFDFAHEQAGHAVDFQLREASSRYKDALSNARLDLDELYAEQKTTFRPDGTYMTTRRSPRTVKFSDEIDKSLEEHIARVAEYAFNNSTDKLNLFDRSVRYWPDDVKADFAEWMRHRSGISESVPTQEIIDFYSSYPEIFRRGGKMIKLKRIFGF